MADGDIFECQRFFGTGQIYCIRGVWYLTSEWPGMTGLELQDEIIHRKIDLPIIFLSAHGDIEMAIACLQKGAFNFLEKPAEPENYKN